jgi:exopolyphosphatase/pppGpp-phosphohydrolase
MEGREDIITAGALILKSFMEETGFNAVRVSERGIRYGLALRELAAGGF